MAIANYFYNLTTRKYVALFGSIFNQLKIKRRDNSNVTQTEIIVPLSYAPFQKVLSRVTQDPDLLNSRTTGIKLPRMSFEIASITYDPTRKLASTQKMRKDSKAETDSSRHFLYSSVPYNLDFNLYIMTNYSEDATQLMEQILPFFTPDWTVTAKMVENLDPVDIPIIMNSVTTEELYEGSYEERQAILYTLTFTVKGYYWGPERKRKIIKFIEAAVHNNPEDLDFTHISNTELFQIENDNDEIEVVELFPIIESNTDIQWPDIEFNDDWVPVTPMGYTIDTGAANTDYYYQETYEDLNQDLNANTANGTLDLQIGYGSQDLNANT